jgi:integrase
MPRSTPIDSHGATKRPNGSGSHYRLPNGRYKAAIKDVTGKIRTKTFIRQIDAQEWLIDQKRIRENGNSSYAVRPKDNVSTFLTRYLDSRQGDIKYNTMKSYRGSVVRLDPYIGSLNAAKLTPRAIESAYAEMRVKGYKPGTLKAAHRLLSAAYCDAFRLQEIPTNPMLNVKIPSGKSRPTQPIPRKDMEKIYQAAVAHSPYALAQIDVGFSTGLRPGEVFGLLWDDIDFDNRTMTIARQVQYVPRKGRIFQSVKQDQIRTIPLTDQQIRILLKHKEFQDLSKGFWKEDLGLIFPNSLGGMKDDSKNRKEFKALCAAAGVPLHQVYQMRKTCYTNMATSGVDIATIKDFSGHSQISTLLSSYVFATNDSLLDATEKLDALRPSINL